MRWRLGTRGNCHSLLLPPPARLARAPSWLDHHDVLIHDDRLLAVLPQRGHGHATGLGLVLRADDDGLTLFLIERHHLEGKLPRAHNASPPRTSRAAVPP